MTPPATVHKMDVAVREGHHLFHVEVANDTDPEVALCGIFVAAVERYADGLDAQAAERVTRWAAERYRVF